MIQDKMISVRIQKATLNNLKRRTREIKKLGKSPISLSEYIRELIRIDANNGILN